MHDPELTSIVGYTAAKYRAPFAGISVITGQRQIIVGAVGTNIAETSIEDSFCIVAIQQGKNPLVVPDAKADLQFSGLRTVTRPPFVRFYAGVPIVDPDGYALGALCIADQEPRLAYFDSTELLIRGSEIERIIRSWKLE